MAWNFAESWDCYAAGVDAANGYWDTSGAANWTVTSSVTRFGAGQALLTSSTGIYLTKSSGVNDAVHHFVVAYRQSAAISGTNLGLYLQLLDGVTGQCAVVFRSDGAILLTSATAAGTTLATYAGAVTAANTWYAFEFEVIINNTTGRLRVRKNGNTSDDFDSGATLNTRPTSINNYANKLQLGAQVVVASYFDDLFWRSNAASVVWLGDIKCNTRYPASDSAVQFSRTGAANFSSVDEPQQNTATDYVYDSTPGHADLYAIGTIATTPASTIATTTRAYMVKSDTGARTAAVQIRSGGTTVASSTLTLLSTGWRWAWRMDLTDPATGSAWTAAAVAASTVGPVVVA